MQWFAEAQKVTQEIAKAKDFRDVEPSQKAFWRLYWGDLPLVECDKIDPLLTKEIKDKYCKVAGAMKAYGDELKRNRGKPVSVALKELANKLKEACIDEVINLPLERPAVNR